MIVPRLSAPKFQKLTDFEMEFFQNTKLREFIAIAMLRFQIIIDFWIKNQII